MDRKILFTTGGLAVLAVILSSCSSPTNQVISAAELPNPALQPAQTQPPTQTPSPPGQVTGTVQVASSGEVAAVPTPQPPFDNNQQPVPPGQAPTPTPPQNQDPKMALADKLASLGAVMYTTGWCPKCKDQARMFGEEAFSKIKTIDCEKDVNVCADKGIHSYPTWEVPGQTLQPGVYPLQDFASMLGLDPTPFQDGSPSRINEGRNEGSRPQRGEEFEGQGRRRRRG
jgi:hypothetical protein